MVANGVTEVGILPSVEFHGKGRLEIFSEKTDATATFSNHIHAHSLENEANSVGAIAVVVAQVQNELKVQGLAQVHLVGIPHTARLRVEGGGDLVAIIPSGLGRSVEEIDGVTLGHDGSMKQTDDGQKKGGEKRGQAWNHR